MPGAALGVSRRQLLAALPAVLAAGGGAAGAAAPDRQAARTAELNLAHLNHLYADIEIDGKPMGVVHIYAAFPDYRFDIEPNEGFTCVDDVARALVLLARERRQRPDPALDRKIRRLTEFVLHLQNSNGYFHNFLWGNLSTNTDYRTSLAELNWWSLRALWGLEETLAVPGIDRELAQRIQSATSRVVSNLLRDLPGTSRETTQSAGIVVPDWLPGGSGADQAAEAIVALLPHWQRTGNPAVRELMASLATGILMMQKGDARTFPHGAFLSWRHHWHAWGNVQAYALLKAGGALDRPDWIRAALIEVDHFYPYLLAEGFAEAIEFRAEGARVIETARQRFPQIAYGLRPMVFAALQAHVLTKDPRYLRLSEDLSAWLSGRNDAHAPVYDPKSGVVFDGIIAPGKFNRNSGAESTIEALLTLQALRDGRP